MPFEIYIDRGISEPKETIHVDGTGFEETIDGLPITIAKNEKGGYHVHIPIMLHAYMMPGDAYAMTSGAKGQHIIELRCKE